MPKRPLYSPSDSAVYEAHGFLSFFSKQLGALIGIALCLFVGVCVLALITWNAADPSLSFANNNGVTNILGYPGAILADLLMQFLGLASIFALLPLFFWAMLLVGHHGIYRFGMRLGYWLLTIMAFGGLFGLIPPPAKWPMPIGLGGVVGDKVLATARFLLPDFSPLVSLFILVAVFSTASVVFLILASGASNKARLQARQSRHKAGRGKKQKAGALAAFSPSLLLGFGVHLFYQLKGFFKRLMAHFRGQKGPAPEETAKTARIEPNFAGIAAINNVAGLSDEAKPVKRKGARKISFPSTRAGFALPLLDYLSEPKFIDQKAQLSDENLQQNAQELGGILDDFGVKGQVINVRPGPVVTLYEFEPAPGIKSSRIIGLADDIARSMRAVSARVAVVPGRNVIGIELPNPHREMVYLREIMEVAEFGESRAKLGLALGKAIGGEPVIADLAKMPHLLVAGTTGSGKSVAINTMILSLLYRMNPDQCRLIMVDPKMLELSVYDGIPHLLTPVVTDPKKAVVALKWAVREMEERYRKMAKIGVRNIDGFNSRIEEAKARGEQLSRTVQTGFDKQTGQPIFEVEDIDATPLPYIVVIIDEMADLMMVAGKEIEAAVQRLAQMARAAGIHVIMATQRPSVDVITGTIKANFPTRISFSVTSKIDSRTILGEQGAEQLLGQGDMLFMRGGGRIQRVHGPFVGDDEVEEVVRHLKEQGMPDYLEEVTLDDEANPEEEGASFATSNDPYDQAVQIILRDRKVSISYIQRRLSIGYNRAATIIERMEEEGLISPAKNGKREILIPEGEYS